MARFYYYILPILLSFTIVNTVQSQGCSDAGACTINSFKPNGNDSSETFTQQIKVGVFLGNADHSITAYGAYVEYTKLLSDHFGLEFKLTSLAQTGNGISTFGVSDVFVSGLYKVNKKFKMVLGVKIPLSQSNNSLNDLALPMDYQASLGTFDVIFGLGYEIKGIELLAAIQQPLSQNNNQFLASSYPIDSELRKFQSTNKFVRNSDILLRVSYPLKFKKKFKLTPSLLPIYHLGTDSYTDELSVEREIVGSDGLTLNFNIYLDYKLNDKSGLQINFGAPLIVRESRPDGLTRSSIVNLEYNFKF